MRGAALIPHCTGGCGGSKILSLLFSLPTPAAPRAGEGAAGWRWCVAACKTECARAWMPDDGMVTFRALEPLRKHHCDNQREPVMTFPGRWGAWSACLLAVGGGVS